MPRVDHADSTIGSQGSMAPDSKDGLERWLVQVLALMLGVVGRAAAAEERQTRAQTRMAERMVGVKYVVEDTGVLS